MSLRKEPILRYVTNNDEKKNPGTNRLKKMKIFNFFNPLVLSILNIGRLAKIFNLGRDPQKNSYERRVYESVNENNLS